MVLGICFLGSFIFTSLIRSLSKSKSLIKSLNFTLYILISPLFLFFTLRILPNSFGLILVLVISVFATAVLGMVAALASLRLSTYPGDRYRASNYGVYDLVELIRQIDEALIRQSKKLPRHEPIAQSRILEISQSFKQEISFENKVNLSFIGHSLGCEVITQSVRVLSDVFSPNAIEGQPDPDIGRIFKLARLVLVAPDIPLESIMPGRANYLRSSLARFAEAYVFSNEGDLALRLASTAANYFSFPSRTRFRGYKLGNITVKHDKCGSGLTYGIVNQLGLLPHHALEIRSSFAERKVLSDFDEFKSISEIGDDDIVANKFTYFDCTDFKDNPSYPQGMLSMAKQMNALDHWDYKKLVYRYFFKKPTDPKYINTHGGYFDGKFTQILIYDIAYMGIDSLISSLDSQCKEKFIQVVLSQKIQRQYKPQRLFEKAGRLSDTV
jgi:hypothetical protein